jgi:hypothetical protein
MNCGSVDSLNFSWRQGCNANACQVRHTESADTPRCSASDRVDQCVAFFGVLSRVVTTIRSTWSSVTVLGRPGRGSSNNPSSRRSANRLRHFVTVGREIRSRSAISPLAKPSAAASTIRERNASACAVFGRRDQASSRSRSASVSSITTAVGVGMNHSYPNCKCFKPAGH